MLFVPIWDSSERLLWGVALAIALMCGIYFIYKAWNREVLNEKIIMYGLSSLPLGFALSLLFTYFQVFQIQGNFIDGTFYGDYDNILSYYEVLGRLSYISLGIGGFFYVLAFDKIIKRTKYSLTIIYAILVITEIVLPLEGSVFGISFSVIARYVFNFPILLGLLILVPAVLYLYTKWSDLGFKAVSSFLLFGFLFFEISLFLAKSKHRGLGFYPLILAPILLVIACCITILPTIVNPKILSRGFFYWVLFAVLSIPFFIFLLYIDIVYVLEGELEIQYAIEFAVAFTYTYIMLFLIIKNIKSEVISKSRKVEKGRESQVLGILTRPQKVTEEEVTYHRERKICLVCKGDLLRAIYLCPECDAIYCIKCSEAISNIDNGCWSCYTPIDPAKPVQLQENEEEKAIGKIKTIKKNL